MLALCLLASLSLLWSQDWRVSLYISLQAWLVFGVFLSLQDRPNAWRAFAWGSIAALGFESAIGCLQFATQSTGFTAALGLNWPGGLQPATAGASVVQLADGTRWLRAYGSLPHPNILGGLVVVLLAGAVAVYLADVKHRIGVAFLVGAGLILLVLTFSRSAWLALAAGALVLALHYRQLDRRRLLILAGIGLVSLALVAIPLRQLIFTRAGGSAVKTEEFSTLARSWLAQESWLMIRERPVLGWGAGSFIIELARRASYGYIVEPVHNVALLATSELGLGGAVLLAGLGASIVLSAWRARRPLAVVFSAAVIGLCVIAMFDHYLWTLAPGRMLWGAALGLFAGQMRLDARSEAV